MYENERNEISKELALEILPQREMFQGCFWNTAKNQAPGGKILRSVVVKQISDAMKIEAVGGYPHFPFVDGLEITISDEKKLLVDFEQRIDIMIP